MHPADVKLADLSLVAVSPQGCAGVSLAIRASLVKPSNSFSLHPWRFVLVFGLAALLLLGVSACDRKGHRVLEVDYVSAPQASLRDQVAAIYNRVGKVKNGDRVEVLEREKRFSRVRTADGIEGWIEQRYLVDQKPSTACRS